MYNRTIPAVLHAFGLKAARVLPCQKGYRSEIWPVELADGTLVGLTFFKREPGILRRITSADKASTATAAVGLPAKVRHDARTLQVNFSSGPTYAAVYNYLDGSTIPWEAYTSRYLKLIGRTMRQLHFALAPLPSDIFTSAYAEYLEIAERMRVYFSSPDVRRAAVDKLGISIDASVLSPYVMLLCDYDKLPGQQVLHLDFVRGNILFTDGPDRLPIISGILDFEKTARGHPLLDAARTFAFLLVDCVYKSPTEVRKAFFRSGYLERGAHSLFGSAQDMYAFVEFFWQHDLYKFMRHNPYESLELNAHYRRTLQALAARNVIQYKAAINK